MAEPVAGALQILPIAGLPELRPGDDLAALLCAAARWLCDGDIVVMTSKAVSKVEGRLLPAPADPVGRERARQDAIAAETARVVAERGATRIVETHHGWVMAAAGVDASNVAAGELALLPVDSDDSARRLREQIRDLSGVRVAVVISDTNGRTWRRGLTDVAIGVAGMSAVVDLRGRPDTSGVPLEITEIAVADEIAAAADLVKGKLSAVPAAVIRGLPLPDDDGQGSASLRRPSAEDMFALGTRDVVRSRRRPTGFSERSVPVPVLHAAIDAAERAVGSAGRFDVQTDAATVQRSDPAVAARPAVRLLAGAAARIVPILAEDADDEAFTRLGMTIAALLIQLHAEGLAADWLSPTEIATATPGPAAGPGRAHGVVVVGHHEPQIER